METIATKKNEDYLAQTDVRVPVEKQSSPKQNKFKYTKDVLVLFVDALVQIFQWAILRQSLPADEFITRSLLILAISILTLLVKKIIYNYGKD